MSEKAKRHLAQDPVLQGIIETTRLRRPRPCGDVYPALLRTIIFQQLSGKAASTIYQRFLQLFKNGYPDARKLVRLSESQLRAVGLSRQKTRYVQNVAAHWIDNQLDSRYLKSLNDEDVIALLTQIKGVGTWTAQMILMVELGRPDVFPISDLGIRNAMVKAYRLRTDGSKLDRRLTQLAEPWRPFRSLACRYLWLWIDDHS